MTDQALIALYVGLIIGYCACLLTEIVWYWKCDDE